MLRVLRRLATYPPHVVVGLPSLSPTMENGTIAGWKVAEGGVFNPGDVIAEIETDKATVDFEAQDEGVVAKHLVPVGTEVAVGKPIMVTVDDVSLVAAFADFVVADDSTAPAPPVAAPVAAPVAPAPAPTAAFLLTPSARFLSHSKGIDVTSLAGSGKGGRITKGDVIHALNSNMQFPLLHKPVVEAPPPAPPAVEAPLAPTQPTAPVFSFDLSSVPTTGAPFVDEKASSMRKTISKRLTESRATVPHAFTSVAVELDEVAKFRKDLAALDVKVSVNVIVIRALALALRDVPRANSSWVDGTAKANDNVDVSVAVATPSGLITPIVTNADQKGLTQIAAEVRDLAGRARIGKLKPEEYQGGTASVSNLGMFGIAEFSAVINPPQACILAVGTGLPRFKVDPKTGTPVKTSQMTSRLSYDRRVIDEPISGLLLATFAHYMANPKLLML